MEICDIAVIGAGPAGAMAAIRAGRLGKKTALLEQNDAIGRKILITGKGRCNITNSAPTDKFIEEFGRSGQFLRTAFSALSNEDLIDFFKSNGLELKTERQGRVFPATDNALSVVDALKRSLAEAGVRMIYNSRVIHIGIRGKAFTLKTEDGGAIETRKVIMATGGASYKATGSGGDGFRIAADLGHKITELRPGLVPLKTKDAWVRSVQGLALKNIRIKFSCGKKKIATGIGEMLFTHFGVSGPLVLDFSAKIIEMLAGHAEAGMFIDLKPGMTPGEIEARVLSEIRKAGNKEMRNFLRPFLPSSMIDVFLGLCGIAGDKKANQMTQAERRKMTGMFKALPLTVTGALPLEEAMITNGGVSTKDINPRTMESGMVPGLYFAGEIIDGAASSGGYNLQQAFSTGYLAGESAANA